MKINIAIDGPSAAGKSTIAKKLAKELQYAYLDTGAMYRCVAYQALTSHLPLDNEEELLHMIPTLQMQFDIHNHVFLNGEDVTDAIRDNEVSMAASAISTHQKVREFLVHKQQCMAKDKGFVMDGRDIGTVVLKDAELKLYLIASVEERSNRRIKEYLSKGIQADYKSIYEDIIKRDFQDMNREVSPLRKADDAIEIDTSYMNVDEVVTYILELISKRKG
ncbi:MAG: (d)CMP kinase [Erysipelotrichaceae bacterium]|nr:(d)CMP kinase [Erysipelotrichaceae bacterium]